MKTLLLGSAAAGCLIFSGCASTSGTAALQQSAQNLSLRVAQQEKELRKLEEANASLQKTHEADAKKFDEANAALQKEVESLTRLYRDIRERLDAQPKTAQAEVPREQIVKVVEELREKERQERDTRRDEFFTGMSDRWLQQMTDELVLDAQQKEKVQAVLAEMRQGIRAALSEARATGATGAAGAAAGQSPRDAMERVGKQTDESMKKILTNEQYEKYLAIRDRMRQRNGRPGGGGPPRGGNRP
jgi:outer membrane murein-binding lipoprotein Lpp